MIEAAGMSARGTGRPRPARRRRPGRPRARLRARQRRAGAAAAEAARRSRQRAAAEAAAAEQAAAEAGAAPPGGALPPSFRREEKAAWGPGRFKTLAAGFLAGVVLLSAWRASPSPVTRGLAALAGRAAAGEPGIQWEEQAPVWYGQDNAASGLPDSQDNTGGITNAAGGGPPPGEHAAVGSSLSVADVAENVGPLCRRYRAVI